MENDGSTRLDGLSRREMLRKLARGTTAMAVSLPWHDLHSIHALLGAGLREQPADSWAPQCLSAQQNETLIQVAECILPNSSKAQVNRFIDLLLSVASAEHRSAFLDSLSAVDRESHQRFGHPFSALSEDGRNKLLTAFSVDTPNASKGEGTPSTKNQLSDAGGTLRQNFEVLKDWVSEAYYSSEVGMRELGWTGEMVFDSYPGCPHAGGHA